LGFEPESAATLELADAGAELSTLSLVVVVGLLEVAVEEAELALGL